MFDAFLQPRPYLHIYMHLKMVQKLCRQSAKDARYAKCIYQASICTFDERIIIFCDQSPGQMYSG